MEQSKIEVWFEQLVALSERLNTVASNLKKSADDTGLAIVSKTKGAWKSENADLFVKREIKALETIALSAERVEQFAKELNEKAARIYELEQWNVRLARLRQYG